MIFVTVIWNNIEKSGKSHVLRQRWWVYSKLFAENDDRALSMWYISKDLSSRSGPVSRERRNLKNQNFKVKRKHLDEHTLSPDVLQHPPLPAHARSNLCCQHVQREKMWFSHEESHTQRSDNGTGARDCDVTFSILCTSQNKDSNGCSMVQSKRAQWRLFDGML